MKLHVWLAVLAFNVIIFCCTLPAFLIALVSRVVRCCCGGRQCMALTTATIYACHFSWRWALRLCGCWIRITFNRDKEAPSGLSMVYVANHQSFLDAMLMTAFSPSSTVAKIRMLASAHLMAFPGLSAIICACGHVLIPVVRNKECEAEMCTRGEQIRQRMELYKHHVQRGGHASWFPEGRLNRGDPTKLELFRAGGFSVATELDVEVWCVAIVGASLCWPPTARIGGRPAKIHVRQFRLCASSHDFLRAAGVSAEQAGDDGTNAKIYLAKTAQDAIQAAVDEMVSKDECARSKRQAWAAVDDTNVEDGRAGPKR